MENFSYFVMDHIQKKVYFFPSKPETISGDQKVLMKTSKRGMIRMLLADLDDKGWHFYVAETH